LPTSPYWHSLLSIPIGEPDAMTIDYEGEYNNRARVPEHPQIFARWQHEAAAYRDGTKGEADLGVSYGSTPRQFFDLFPATAGNSGALAMFIHGGYWRSLEPASFSHMARGLNARGVTVAVAGYDLCPKVTIADIIDEMRRACLTLWRRFGQRIMIYGHSAGGHLAACLLATDWKGLDRKAPADLVPAAYSISGVFDLTPLIGISMNQDLRLDEPEARKVSPLFWPPPKDRVLDAVVGGAESSEFLRQSKIIAKAWGKDGTTTRLEAVPDTNHFTVIDALTDPQSAMVGRLVELCALTSPAA
jgi:arylformamidase